MNESIFNIPRLITIHQHWQISNRFAIHFVAILKSLFIREIGGQLLRRRLSLFIFVFGVSKNNTSSL